MKFATLALLVASVAAADKKDDLESRLTDEQKKDFFQVFMEDAKRFWDMPNDSKARRHWMKWMRGDAKKEMMAMRKFVYAKDGPWDQFAGDDGRMTLDEAKVMYDKMAEEMGKQFEGKMPERPKGFMKRAFHAYNSLSEGDGFTKKDAKDADKIIEGIKRYLVNWQPTEEQKKAFRPVWKEEMKRYHDLDEDSKQYMLIHRWLNHHADRKVAKMQEEMKKGFKEFAGDDGRMNLEESKAFNAAVRKAGKAMYGEDIAPYSEAAFKTMYDAYNSLSKGEGFTTDDIDIANAIASRFRDHRITDEEIDTYYPMAEMNYYEAIEDLDDDSKAKKDYLRWVKEGYTDEEKKMLDAAWDKFDTDNNGRLSHSEWMKGDKEFGKMAEKIYGDDAPEFSRGQKEFMWIMADSMKNGGWNEWGHHKPGVSKADHRRLMRILRKASAEILEDEEDSDSDSDSDSDDDHEEAGDDSTDNTDFLLI